MYPRHENVATRGGTGAVGRDTARRTTAKSPHRLGESHADGDDAGLSSTREHAVVVERQTREQLDNTVRNLISRKTVCGKG
jgi:hypothetical protein